MSETAMPARVLERALDALLPRGAAGAVEFACEAMGDLAPGEAAAIASAVPARRAEFAAGRRAARRAMARLGYAPAAILTGADRAPVWPAGLIGSITHCDGHCMAVVAPTGAIRALGIDLEGDGPLPDDLVDTVCTATECRWLATLPQAERGSAAKRVFGAKEAAYKMQYPLTRRFLEFHDVETAPCDAGFRVHLPDIGAVTAAQRGTMGFVLSLAWR